MSENILSLSSPTTNVDNAGGKGASLAALTRAGFTVPPGFIVTIRAYRAFVEGQGIQPRILALVEHLAPDQPEPIERASQEIRAMFARAKMPEALSEEILREYRGLASLSVAVRSSANAEDLPGFAFAGQQDTFLNITGDDQLLDAVKRCWASLWTARAISYRARSGFSPQTVALAVVVQQLIPAEVSGVLFTADPLTGKRGEIHIDASYGLGEAIVSGQVEPDHYVVDPLGWQITARRLGAKQVIIQAQPGGGTARVEAVYAGNQAAPEEQAAPKDQAAPETQAAPEDQAAPETQALADARILDLARLGQRVADFYGAPQDIEWAWAGDRFYLLQSRPITSLYPLPASAPTGGALHVYFNFNAIQGVPDPLTPLGIDALHILFGSVVGRINPNLRADQVMPQAGDRLFLDFGDLPADPTLRKIVAEFLSSTEPGERDILLRLVADGRIPQKRVLTPWMGLRMLRFMAPMLASGLAGLARYRAVQNEVERNGRDFLARVEAGLPAALFTPQTPLPSPENLPAAEELPGAEVTPVTGGAAPAAAAALAGILNGMETALPTAGRISVGVMPPALIAINLVDVLDGWMVRWLGDPPGSARPLLRSLPGNVTVAMTLRLWAAAQAIRSDAASFKMVSETPAEQLAEQYRQGRLPAAAQQALAQFLRTDGMRGVAEIDLGKPRWREDPAPVLRTLQGYLRLADPNQAPDVIYRRGAEQAEALIADTAARLRRTRFGGLRARLFTALARRVRALASLREIPLFYLSSALALYREALLKAGAALVEQGILARADDIFLLPFDTLKRWSRTGTVDLRGEVDTQRAIYARELLRRQTPRVMLSTGEAFYDAPPTTGAPAAAGENSITGVPVSPGVAEGRARVILDPNGARMEPGEILVCPSTDPGWTPLFLTAAGLVMEIGGMMTHGSVTAREYGIPAVVGVRGATERIKTGQLVRVDGTTGVVKVE